MAANREGTPLTHASDCVRHAIDRRQAAPRFLKCGKPLRVQCEPIAHARGLPAAHRLCAASAGAATRRVAKAIENRLNSVRGDRYAQAGCKNEPGALTSAAGH